MTKTYRYSRERVAGRLDTLMGMMERAKRDLDNATGPQEYVAAVAELRWAADQLTGVYDDLLHTKPEPATA